CDAPRERREAARVRRQPDRVGRQVDTDVERKGARLQFGFQYAAQPLQMRTGPEQVLVAELAVLQPDAAAREHQHAVGTIPELEAGAEPCQGEEQLDVPALRVLLQRQVLRRPAAHRQPFAQVSRSGTMRLKTGAPGLDSLRSAT